ncbi:hypothetical protein [Microvirga sp. 2TAF3]|uniref:hypothetical protein n=1 Tax=Microvirga sp. 2TAF3 TaxID=3233014 RepID=UPI003F950A8A
MRRNDLANLEGLNPDTRKAAEVAARRAGLTLEDWIAATLAERAQRQEPADRWTRRRPGDELDAIIARMARTLPNKTLPKQPASDLDTIIAAAATAEKERLAQDQASRTTVALESMAMWIEQAEERLNETARTSADHQDRMASVLSQALSALKDRLDAVERRVTAEPTPARVEFPVQDAMKALSPLADTLFGLRTDVSRLAKRLDQPTIPAVEDIRSDIERLRSGMENLATRDEIITLDQTFRLLSRDLERGPSSKDLLTLAGSVAGLHRQVQSLSEEMAEGVHRRIGAEIDLLKRKIDNVAETGIDRSVIDFLSSQIVDMRQDLAQRAEPQQIERLSDDVAALSGQIVELRANQVGRSDFAALKSSLENVCAALTRSVAAHEASDMPEQLRDMSRRLDLLVSRPEPERPNIDSIADQLAVLTDRMASIAESRLEQNDTLNVLFDRLSNQIEAVVGNSQPLQAPLLQRFERLESELRQVGQQADTSAVEIMLRSLHEKLEEKFERTPVQDPSLNAIEQRMAALADQVSRTPEPLKQALEDTTAHIQALRNETALMAERAARAVLKDAQSGTPATDDFDALKAGFVELKALQTRADKRTQQALRAVHDALETLVSRFPDQAPTATDAAAHGTSSAKSSEGMPSADRLEAAVRRLHAAALSQIEEISAAVPEPASVVVEKPAREPEAPHSVAAAVSSHDMDLGNVRASFIAAARRASHPLPAQKIDCEDPETALPVVDEAADGGPGREVSLSPTSLIERIRRTLDAHRRPLLFSLAFLILAAGTAQIFSNTPHVPAPLTASAEAAPKEPVRATAPEETTGSLPKMLAAASETGLFQPSSLMAPSGPATPRATAKFIVDPGTLGEIPAEIPAALRQAALSGDAEAVYEIALRAAEGRGLQRNSALAVRLYERAAQAGLAPAQERLAMLYDKGVGIPRDAKLAVSWYERAAQGGNVRAMHNLATLLAAGVNGKPDYPAALRWYMEAAESGVRDSQFNVGVLYARGIGTRKDLAKAYQWFSLAYAQGDAEAAKKRDEVASRLSEAELNGAKSRIESWRPRAIDPLANEVKSSDEGGTAALSHDFGNRS